MAGRFLAFFSLPLRPLSPPCGDVTGFRGRGGGTCLHPARFVFPPISASPLLATSAVFPILLRSQPSPAQALARRRDGAATAKRVSTSCPAPSASRSRYSTSLWCCPQSWCSLSRPPPSRWSESQFGAGFRGGLPKARMGFHSFWTRLGWMAQWCPEKPDGERPPVPQVLPHRLHDSAGGTARRMPSTTLPVCSLQAASSASRSYRVTSAYGGSVRTRSTVRLPAAPSARHVADDDVVVVVDLLLGRKPLPPLALRVLRSRSAGVTEVPSASRGCPVAPCQEFPAFSLLLDLAILAASGTFRMP